MAFRYRQEIVGKRFLGVKKGSKLKIKDFKSWEWQSGVVRALTDREYLDPEVSVLLEFDGQIWNDRKWLKLTEKYQLFLVERTIVWVSADPDNEKNFYLGLSFEVLLDKVGYKKLPQVPVETLLHHTLKFSEVSRLTFHKENVDDARYSESELIAVKQWYQYQDGQQILIQTPTVLVGYRVEVYRAEGTTQWFTAVIQSYNEKLQELRITDDTVLEEHFEDPALVEIRLIGDGVIESILRGDDLRVRPSRTRRSLDKTNIQVSSFQIRGTNNNTSTTPVCKKPSTTYPKEAVVVCNTKVEPGPLTQPKEGKVEAKGQGHLASKIENNVKANKDRKRKSEGNNSKGNSNKTPSSKDTNVHSGYETTKKTIKSINTSSEITSNLRDPNNRTPTKSLIVPLCDISPKKNKGRRCLSASPNSKKEKRTIGADQCQVKTRKRLRSLELITNSGLDSICREKRKAKDSHEETVSVKNKVVKDCNNTSPSTSRAKSQENSKSTQKERQQENSTSNTGQQQSNESHAGSKKNTRKSIDKGKTADKKAGDNNKVIKDKTKKGKANASCSNLKNAGSDNNSITLELQGTNSSKQKSIDVEHSKVLSSAEEKATNPRTKVITSTEKCVSEDSKCTENSNLSVNNTSVVAKSPTVTSTVSSFSLLNNNSKGVTVVNSKPATGGKNVESKSKEIVSKPTIILEGSDSSSRNNKDNTDTQECNQNSLSAVTCTQSIAKISRNYSPCTVSPSEDSRDMHYKKTLLGDYQRKESGGQVSPDKAEQSGDKSHIDTAGINLNQSLTDQIARREKEKSSVKSDHHHRTWEDAVISSSKTNGLDSKTKLSDNFTHNNESKVYVTSSSSSSNSYSHYVQSDRKSENKPISMNSSNIDSDRIYHHRHYSDDRSHTRINDSRPSTSTISSRDLRTEERSSRERDASNSSNSPLLVDKARPVEPYRDPELLKKDEYLRIQAIQQKQQQQQTSQSVHNPLSGPMNPASSVPGGLGPPHPAALPAAHAAVLSQAHPLLTHLGAMVPQQYASIQEAALAAQLGYIRQLAIQPNPLTPITFSGIQNPYQTRQLELLWQQKFPNIQVPPGWLLHQYQDELLRDVNMLQHRDMIEREREIRERELAIERERMDREMREREDRERERAERERIERERERQERERQERDRQERERREREERDRIEREKAAIAERERQERERREKERQQEQQRERERREILMESQAAADAVDKHFQASLNRLSSQQHKAFSTGTWIPGGATTKPSPLQAMSVPSQPQYKVSAFSQVAPPASSSQHSPHHVDRKPEEKPRVTEYPPMSAHSHGRNPSPADIKPKLSPQDLSQKSSRMEHDNKQGISLRESLIKGFPPNDQVHMRADTKPFPGYPGYPHKGTTSSATAGSAVPTTAGQQVKQEPNFNLYGYPYRQSHPMYISQDKLQQGLKEEKGGIKQEPTDLRNKAPRPMNSPPPLVKSEPNPGSVIVENKPDISHGAHVHGSITLGTSNRGHHPEDSKVGIVTTSSQIRTASPHVSQAMKGHNPSSAPPPLQTQQHMHIPVSHANNIAFTSAMQQAYLAAMAQQLSQQQQHQTAATQSPIYSQSKDSSSSSSSHGEQQRQELSPSSQKRRAQQMEQAGGINIKKTKIEPGSHTAGGKSGTGTYIDSFRSFVENAVQSAFYQDIETRDKMMKQHWQQQQQQLAQQQQQAKPQTNKQPEQHQQLPQQQPESSHSVEDELTIRSSTPNTVTSTTVSQVVLSPSATAPSISPVPTTSTSPPVSAPPPKENCLPHPPPVSTPSGASSISSIQETINRVANGIDTDSDTLSAPSPPPTLKSSDAPSPVRFPPSKPSFKKAILARYSDSIPNCENSNSSLCDQSPPKLDKQEKMEVSPLAAKEADNPSNKPAMTMKSPLSMLKDLNAAEKEDMTTSASEAESQDNDSSSTTSSKGRKKTAKRKSENNASCSGNKKQKSAASSDAEAYSEPNPKKKKKNSKTKGEEHKDGQSKGNKLITNDKQQSDSMPNSGTCGVPTKASQKQPPLLPPKLDKMEDICTDDTVNRDNINSDKNLSVEKEDSCSKSKDNKKKSSKQHNTDEKVDQPPPVKPKSNWDCERKLREWKQKQQKKAEKDGSSNSSSSTNASGKKGGKKNGDKNDKNKDKSQEKDGGDGSEDDGKENPSSILANKPLNKEPHLKLKKSQDPFLQDASCGEIAPKLMKCRECKMRNKKLPNIFCRFYAFRRLKYNPKGCSIAGFSEPSDADVDDIELWYPRFPLVPSGMDLEMAKYVMNNVGDRFCELVEQEKEAMMWVSPDTKIVWKRAVQGVREMCDVCDTTLFNMHWCCHKCGFVVCIDCYRNKAKKIGSNQDKSCKVNEEASSNQKWLTCSANRQQHEPDKLRITQIIPSDVLWALGTMIHDVRDEWNIQSNCPCGHVSSKVNQVMHPKNGMSHHLFNAVAQGMSSDQKDNKPLVNGIGGNSKKNNKIPSIMDTSALNGSPLMSPLNLLAEAAASRESECKKEGDLSLNAVSGSGKVCSTLRDLLTRQGTVQGMKAPSENCKRPKVLTDILQEVVDKNQSKEDQHHNHHQRIKTIQFSHYVPKSGAQMLGRNSPIPTYTLKETSVLYPDIPHSWLDHGRLLRLHDPRCTKNLALFQQQWRRGQPVIVSHCDKNLNKELWTPKAFSKEFGQIENDLVNCSNGVVMMGHKMKVFWDGFEKMGTRLKDGKNRPLNLKLKDWPPTEDFSELMPSRFHDLMQGLPLPEYTNRTGTFNLACRLPEFFVKPDLGPKLYNAYGSASQRKTGSTNLHLDMSDATNLMMYVGVAEDDKEAQQKAVMEIMEEAGCCEFTVDRAVDSGELPGALWHIFDPQDADKIRDLLNKVGSERGDKVDLNHDPIHDQSWYLDRELRDRLLVEYGVQGYTIVQYLGDAIFIPAGAPHQVKNLHSCIKAAEDFVSPENINHCFKMTQEFRYLSGTHSNHEDKLQIKNIIYHAVKDAVAVLQNNNPNCVQ